MKTTCELYNHERGEENGTFVVFGSARGGTSMVAGCMAGLGLHMGNDLPQNYEDPEFVRRPIDLMIKTIQRKSTHHEKWGWKYPEASNYLDELKDDIRSPRLIVVFRDLVSIANKQQTANGVDFENSLINNSLLLQRNIFTVLKWKVPTLLVSYEKATNFKEEFLNELAAFVHCELPADKSELLAFMEPGTYKSTFADKYV